MFGTVTVENFHGLIQNNSLSKITDNNTPLGIDQQIVKFQISVDNLHDIALAVIFHKQKAVLHIATHSRLQQLTYHLHLLYLVRV